MSINISIDLMSHPKILHAAADFIRVLAQHAGLVNASADVPTPPQLKQEDDSGTGYVDEQAIRQKVETEFQEAFGNKDTDENLDISGKPFVNEKTFGGPAFPVVTPNDEDEGPIDPSLEPLDVAGMPWSPEIHSRGRTKAKDGTWKKQRGIDPRIVRKVEARLRSETAPATDQIVTPPSPPVIAAPTRMVGLPGLLGTPGAIVSGQPIVAPPPPPPPAAVEPNHFADLMLRITSALASKKLTNAQVGETLKRFGLPDLAVARSFPELLPQLIDAIKELTQ